MTEAYADRTLVWLDVRRADHDVPAFVRQMVELLEAAPDALIDIAGHEDHGNRIPLRRVRGNQEMS